MRTRLLFILSILGIAAGLLSAELFAVRAVATPPVFTPAMNPYEHGVYATGILESDQLSGANVNLFPEVAGTVVEVLAHEGQHVKQGDILVRLEDGIQRATVEQQRAQAAAALALLEELRAQPRPETLRVSESQVTAAHANLKTTKDQLAKQRAAYAADPRAVSRSALDDATNAVRVAWANLEVARRQLALVQAGAWVYEVRNQEAQLRAAEKAVAAAEGELGNYTIHAPVEGTVLSINAAAGSYVSPQGTLDTYTRGAVPLIVMGRPNVSLAVRAFIDEILIARLGRVDQLQGSMFVRGTSVRVPLEFVRVQPYVSPKVELANARAERVDLRVLPVVFRFTPPPELHLYPGQLVDVYVQGR